MARPPKEKPDAATFGQLVSELLKQRDADGNKVWANANQIKDAYGESPGDRTWEEINDQGKAYQRNAPKGS